MTNARASSRSMLGPVGFGSKSSAKSSRIVADSIKKMLGLLQAIASSPEMVSAPEQASVLGLLPIALIGGIFEGLSLSSCLNNPQNSIFFGLREIYVSIVVRDVDDDIERVRHVSPLSGNRWLMSACLSEDALIRNFR
jgi:hypothetical protein